MKMFQNGVDGVCVCVCVCLRDRYMSLAFVFLTIDTSCQTLVWVLFSSSMTYVIF